jgi:hypothetical protein
VRSSGLLCSELQFSSTSRRKPEITYQRFELLSLDPSSVRSFNGITVQTQISTEQKFIKLDLRKYLKDSELLQTAQLYYKYEKKGKLRMTLH